MAAEFSNAVSKKAHELYGLISSLESSNFHLRREIDSHVRTRDHLLELIRKHNNEVVGPEIVIADEDGIEATCRNCDAPMGMTSWAEQFCHFCSSKDR